MIEVVTPAETKSLVTLAILQGMPWYPGSSADATLETLVIPAASQAIVDHCSREFVRQEYRETVASFGSSSVLVSAYPVESIVSCSIDGTAVDLSDLAIEDREAGEIGFTGRVLPCRPRWSGRLEPIPVPRSEERAITLQFWAGYRVSGDPITLPANVGLAAVATCQEFWGELTRDPAVLSKSVTFPESVGGGSSTIAYSVSAGTAANLRPGGLPPKAIALLRPYVRKRAA